MNGYILRCWMLDVRLDGHGAWGMGLKGIRSPSRREQRHVTPWRRDGHSSISSISGR